MEITQTMLAELAGVSQNTVHRALHGMSGVSEATRERIHALASERGYRLNTAARTMRTGRTGQVGVMVFDSASKNDNPTRRYVHPALFELTWGVNNGLGSAGYVTSLVRLTDVDSSNAENARIFREHILDGVVVANILPDALIKKVEQLVPRCVWLDTNIWRSDDCIQRDEVHAGRLAARALIDAGHRQIIYFSRPEKLTHRADPAMTHYSNEARLRGLYEECATAGVQVIPIPLMDMNLLEIGMIESHLRNGAGLFINRLSEARRVAVLSAQSGNLRWGIDYSLASADDAADLDWWWPELARASFDRLAMGHTAAQMMLAQLNNDSEGRRSRRVEGKFIAGSTIRK